MAPAEQCVAAENNTENNLNPYPITKTKFGSEKRDRMLKLAEL